jgi:hypothetical protein
MSARRSERGAAALIMVMLLFAFVAVILAWALNMATSETWDSHTAGESANALFLAEGGVERAAWRFADGTACADLGGDGPYALGQGSFTISSSADTDFDTATALPVERCRVRVSGAVNHSARIVEAILEKSDNLLAEANSDFNNPEPCTTSSPPTGWVLTPSSGSWDCRESPYDRTAYVVKPSPGPLEATAAGQFGVNITVSAPVTLTMTFDYAVDTAEGGPNKMYLVFELSDGTTTYTSTPNPFQSGDTGGAFNSGSVTFTIGGSDSVVLTSLNFALTAKAGRPKEVWLDNLVLQGPGGTGTASIKRWREVVSP